MGQDKRQAERRREPTFEFRMPLRVSAASPGERRKKQRRKPARRKRSLIGRFAYWSVVLMLWAGMGGIGMVVWTAAHLPPIQSLDIPQRPPSIKIVDVQERTLATRGNMGGAVLKLKDLPTYVPKAFLAIEDRRFYDHYGVDPYGIARAIWANVSHRGVAQGGSTLTQQLAKNLFLTQERTLERKLQEVVLALWLEEKFSKTQILELYLNRVYFGAGAYGVEQASQRYFGKSARQLTLAEAALLAGLVRSPSRLAPTHNFDAAERRAKVVLKAMNELGYINGASEHAAQASPPRIVAQSSNGMVNYLADWVMDALNDVLGHIDEDITVHTTIDANLQTSAEKILSDELVQKGAKFKVSQGALVAMTPDGAVRAMVGGRDYAQSQFNRAVSAKRQPGSAFKPFVYLAALEKGLTPSSVREDRPIRIKDWQPENYGHDYYGPVTLTQALAMSLNTVSVRLTMEVGAPTVARTAHRLGIASHLEANASLALGTSEVSLLELAGAYAPFANGGLAVSPHVIARITTGGGKLLYARVDRPLGRVIDIRNVSLMNDMMQQTLTSGTARTTTFTGWPAAGKTGTSQDFRDAWFVGYTARLVTGVWLGNDDNSQTRRVTGGSLPLEVWSQFMTTAHQGVPVASLPSAGGGGIFSGVYGSASAAGNEAIPPAGIGASGPAEARGTASLDNWLINKLFGSRQ